MRTGLLSVVALLAMGLVVGLFIGSAVSRPPKLAVALARSAYADPCRSGELYGVRRDMTRREVLRSFGMLDTDFESSWYIEDETAGLPPDQIVARMASGTPPGSLAASIGMARGASRLCPGIRHANHVSQ
jgi:hypothetical protein